jgi:MFS family permease
MARSAFWKLAISNALIITGAMTLGAILVPIAKSWNHTAAQAAMLASIMSVAGMAGSVLFGWIADRIGGARGLALVAFDCGVLWLCLLTGPTLPVLIAIIALLGLHGTGAVPNFSRAISTAFGRENFSRVFGLGSMMALPFAVTAIVGSSAIFEHTKSYDLAIMAMAAGMFLVAPLGFRAQGDKLELLIRSRDR